MNNKSIILAFVICGFLLFGCLGIGESPPPTPEPTTPTNTTHITQNVNVTIGVQQNQSAHPQPTQNQSTPDQQSNLSIKEIDYIEDPTLNLGVYFIDVGGPELHGSAILVKKGDFDMLIDAGPKEEESKVVDFLRTKNVDDIDVLVSTSADPRNYGGIEHVLDNYRVEQFWYGGNPNNDQTYAQVINRVSNISKKKLLIGRGFDKTIDGVDFKALNPNLQQPYKDVNNDAVVLRISDRNFTALLSSNIQTGAQGDLINQQKDLIRSDIMQAPYYGVGAGTAQIGLYLIGVNPKTIIITGSADEDAQNGGSRDPFRRYMRQYNVSWVETYKNGSVRVIYDGNQYSIDSLGSGN